MSEAEYELVQTTDDEGEAAEPEASPPRLEVSAGSAPSPVDSALAPDIGVCSPEPNVVDDEEYQDPSTVPCP